MVFATLVWLLLTLPATAAEWVDLELVLLADASRSIDDGEIQFQRRNYADALLHPDVLGAIANGYRGRIAVTYVEWGDENWQDVVVPWTVIDGKATAQAFIAQLMVAPRRAQGPNAIGSAIAAGHALIDGNDLEGERQVIDFSGDSAYTFGGISVPLARAAALAAGITINGLAILCRECVSGRPLDYDLEGAFRDFIVGGPGAFVVTAEDRKSFAEAVRRKLLLEIAGRMPKAVARR
ncbi:MAG: DUF1194 domain-containing protein [Alphaproteobacteria bacterium]